MPRTLDGEERAGSPAPLRSCVGEAPWLAVLVSLQSLLAALFASSRAKTLLSSDGCHGRLRQLGGHRRRYAAALRMSRASVKVWLMISGRPRCCLAAVLLSRPVLKSILRCQLAVPT